jgi:hypothetical protein
MSILSICWLVPKDPGPFPGAFEAKVGDYDRFVSWFTLLFSVKRFDDEIVQHVVATYDCIRLSHAAMFNFDFRKRECPTPLHKRVLVDVFRCLHFLRQESSLTTFAVEDDDLLNTFGRILLYSCVNGIEYRVNLCDLLVPIFHVCYYGIWASPRKSGLPFEMPAMEALTADAFVRFLSRPPIAYGTLFAPESDGLTKFVELLECKLEPFQLGQLGRDMCRSETFMSWTESMFSSEFDFEQTIMIWEWMFDNVRKCGFVDAFAAFCAQLALEMREHCITSGSAHLCKLLEDLDDVDPAPVLRQAVKLLTRKNPPKV